MKSMILLSSLVILAALLSTSVTSICLSPDGLDSGQKSTVMVNDEILGEDHCVDQNTLVEFYCGEPLTYESWLSMQTTPHVRSWFEIPGGSMYAGQEFYVLGEKVKFNSANDKSVALEVDGEMKAVRFSNAYESDDLILVFDGDSRNAFFLTSNVPISNAKVVVFKKEKKFETKSGDFTFTDSIDYDYSFEVDGETVRLKYGEQWTNDKGAIVSYDANKRNILHNYRAISREARYKYLHCKGGCDDGACLEVVQTDECDGCLTEDSCVLTGETIDGQYCDGESMAPKKGKGESCLSDYECTESCINGVCQMPCDGCIVNNVCLQQHEVLDASYCVDGDMVSQSADGDICSAAMECSSNLCTNGKCGKGNFIDWLKGLFNQNR